MASKVISVRDNAAPEQEVEQLSPQRKKAEIGRFLLQVDRQTKGSYPTVEAAGAAGMIIKKKHPVVQVSIYDSIETSNTLIELPPRSA